MDGEKKNNVKVLGTNDIRKHAHNWNLAGDVGLLALLEQFSENLCKKTQETQKNFDELVENYEQVFAKIGNVTNQFLALQNCQFVENRVYDEETPTEEKTEVKPKQDAAEQEKLLLAQYKEAVETGIKLLDTHFNEVQLPPNSDSEEDDEVSTGNSLIWKPKNPYAGKKFPLLIGSSEWWSDDHVGLGDPDDNLDTDKIISDSESEMESTQGIQKEIESSSSSSIDNEKIIPTKPKFLKSSTEDIFGWDGNDNDNFSNEDFTSKDRKSIAYEPQDFYSIADEKKDVKIDNFDEPFREDRISDDMGDDNDDETIDTKPSKINNAFTKELAAKLASVSRKVDSSKGQSEKENAVMSKGEEKKVFNSESLFDETDDSSDLFSSEIKNVTKSNKTLFFDAENDDNLFSGSNNLFSDSGNIFEKSETKSPSTHQNSQDKQISNNKVDSTPPKKPLVNNLFEDLDDESTLFASPIQNKANTQSLLPEKEKSSKIESNKLSKGGIKSGGGLFDDLDDEFDDNFIGKPKSLEKNKKDNESTLKTSEIKSTSNNIYSSNDKEFYGKVSTTEIQPPIVEKSSTPEQSRNASKVSPSSSKKANILGGFDDEDDLFSSGFKEDSLFKEDKKSNSSVKPTLLLDDDDTPLFVDKPKLQDSLSISSSRSSLFEETISSKTRLASVFEKDKNYKTEGDIFNTSSDPLFGEDGNKSDLFLEKSSSKPTEKKKSSLFDDFDDDTDDLFGPAKIKVDSSKKDSLFEINSNAIINEKEEKKVVDNDDLFGEKELEKQIKSTKNATLEEPEDDDLFKISNFEKTIEENTNSDIVPKKENLSVANNDIFATPLAKTTSAASFFSAVADESLFKIEEKASVDVIKPKPPSSLSLSKDDVIPKPKSVGKLNIPDNLKNKFESMAKNISSGEIRPKEEKSIVDFDEPAESSTNVLKCPSKDRVKIQVRRRPQSRRARQEAIRKSSIDFLVEEEKPLADTLPAKVPQKESAPNTIFAEPSSVASNPLSPSTDEEDYFNVPELDTNYEKEDQSIFKTDVFSTSNSSKLDDNLLFDSAPVLSPLSPKTKIKKAEVKSLFSSSHESDEDKDGQTNPLYNPPSEGAKIEQSETDLFVGKQKTESTFLFDSEEEQPQVDDKQSDSLFDSSKSKLGMSNNTSNLFFATSSAEQELEDDHLFAPKVNEKTDSLFDSEKSKMKNETKQMIDEDSDSDSLFGSFESKTKIKNSIVASETTQKSESFKSSSVLDSTDSVQSSLKTSNSSAKPKEKKISIFGEDDNESDDDDNLFKTPKTSLDSKKGNKLFQSPKSKSPRTTKESLFDANIDDEDDLFGGKLIVSSEVTKENTKESSQKSEEIKKKENSSFVDPLGLMSNDD